MFISLNSHSVHNSGIYVVIRIFMTRREISHEKSEMKSDLLRQSFSSVNSSVHPVQVIEFGLMRGMRMASTPIPHIIKL